MIVLLAAGIVAAFAIPRLRRAAAGPAVSLADADQDDEVVLIPDVELAGNPESA